MPFVTEETRKKKIFWGNFLRRMPKKISEEKKYFWIVSEVIKRISEENPSSPRNFLIKLRLYHIPRPFLRIPNNIWGRFFVSIFQSVFKHFDSIWYQFLLHVLLFVWNDTLNWFNWIIFIESVELTQLNMLSRVN